MFRIAAYKGEIIPPLDPYNPLNLPANTVRVKTSDGNPPTKASATSYETATLVAGTTDEYDVYKSGTDFSKLLESSVNVIKILGANTKGITRMSRMCYGLTYLNEVALFDTSSVTNTSVMFSNCTSLTSVPLFDTSNNVYFGSMFSNCRSLTSLPAFDASSCTDSFNICDNCSSIEVFPLFRNTQNITKLFVAFSGMTSLKALPDMQAMFPNVTDVRNCFRGCTGVESGIIDAYNYLSTKSPAVTNYSGCFTNCGSNTVTGAAELAQIPSSWGGTAT